MKVRELIDILRTHDPEQGVAVCVGDHHYGPADRRSHGPMCVGLLNHYAGQVVIIGNLGFLRDNGNWSLVREKEDGTKPAWVSEDTEERGADHR